MRIHLDHHDDIACLVLPLGVFKGGALVLKDAGLVAPLCSGQAGVFCSARSPHGNMPYEGYRFSLVFHSDRSGRGWAENTHGWGNSKWASLDEALRPRSAPVDAQEELEYFREREVA